MLKDGPAGDPAALTGERRLLALVENHFDGLSLSGADFVVQYVSPAFTRILGYAREDAVGQSSAAWLHADDVARERPAFRRMMQSPGSSHTAVMRNRHKDGSWRWVESTTTNLLHDPTVRAIVATFRDVTERVLAEQSARDLEAALRRSEGSFRALLDRLPVGVLVHRGGRVVYGNRTVSSLLGYPDVSDLCGASVFTIIAPEQHAEVRERIAALESAVHAYNPPRTSEMVRKDGSRVAVEVEALRVGFDGEPSSLVLLRDLTERRDLLARMAVADRMRSVGMLAAGVAHEINNPLAYVLGNLSVLAEELSAPVRRLPAAEVAQLVADARDGAMRVRDVVRDLHTLSRGDEGAMGVVQLRDVLESCMKMAANEVRFRAALSARLEPTSPVRGTESRLGQVFLNLLINAAHAIPEGSPDQNSITISARPVDAERVVVEVADTGCGIPPAIIGRIFDPFFTTKPPGVGTGLGLAICHGIVQSFGGTIEVESEPGRGSTFRVTLPVAGPAQERAASSPESPASPAGRPAPPRRCTVLVVDDEPAIGKTLRLMLQNDHDVVTVTHARDALARIEAGDRYDVVLCDLMMPGMSGIDLFATVERSRPELASRFVFLTGGAFTETSREFLAANKNPRIEKPFAVDALREAIANVLG